jgi:hypothetical protein
VQRIRDEQVCRLAASCPTAARAVTDFRRRAALKIIYLAAGIQVVLVLS